MRIKCDNIYEALTAVFLTHSEPWINDRYCYVLKYVLNNSWPSYEVLMEV